MKYHIEEQSSKFAYLQLYEQLRADIVKGVLPYGAKLPSKRLFAEETGVSVITVEHTYSILCEEGYIESRQRSGYFVIYKESDFLSLAESPHQERYHTKPAHGVKCEFPFSVLSKTMRKVLADYREEILVKSPNRGCAELRTAIANYLARSNGMSVRPEQIVIGSGAEYLYSLIVQLLGNRRKFALENPSYDKIRRVYEANSVECDMLELGKNGIRTRELERTDATVLHITPFNSFPSGITASVSKRHEYLRWAEKRDGYIIEDNYDSEMTVSKKNEDTVFSLDKSGKVVYLNTFSQTIAPSMRIGYMVLPEQMVENFRDKLGFYSCTVPVFEQYVLTELINSGDFERHINRVRRARRRANKNLVI
ncbi:MAG: PLP-dependent aminotransferase family protein [Tyzzerella sp.]|nr:PLP-dependent aminotransferase family protein [Tyzzerella sp.]